jgi:prepilin signal peptidase PulO-like enzyme (type II secretory pathway)
MGDVKLFALSSLHFGTVERCFDALLLASILGLFSATIARRRVIPFAPALLSGALLVILIG